MLKQIFWDWNGTLLNDLQYAINVRARSFPAFGLKPVQSLDEYYRQFTFPIRQYYANAGVTDEQFDAVAHAWMAEYERGFSEVCLFEDTIPVLKRFSLAAIRQVMLSATKLDMLKQQVDFFSLSDYFDTLLGLADIYARSKEEIGRNYLKQSGILPEETCMIGDTLHDAEVAEALHVSCVLISRGHQSAEQLKTAGVPVVANLTDAANLLLKSE